jgi:hypothetical protein
VAAAAQCGGKAGYQARRQYRLLNIGENPAALPAAHQRSGYFGLSIRQYFSGGGIKENENGGDISASENSADGIVGGKCGGVARRRKVK